jgi:hypothetical protein
MRLFPQLLRAESFEAPIAPPEAAEIIEPAPQTSQTAGAP